MPTEDKLPVYQQNLSKTQKEAYDIRRANVFKGTIAVCVLYAVLATLILLITLFTNFGKTVLADTLFAFTITIIAGMILIVVILGISVSNYQPPEITFDLFNSLSCPDYYTLEAVPKGDLNQYPKEKQPYLNYRCVANSAVYPEKSFTNNNTTYYVGIGTTTSVGFGTNSSTFVGIGTASADPGSTFAYSSLLTGKPLSSWNNYRNDANLSTLSYNPLKCDTVYPYLMANHGSLNDVPNVLNCEWSKMCQVPWSSVCPKL